MHDPVVCLDFASLYPSIMQAHNLCHSTLVLDPAFDKLEGVEYFEVVLDPSMAPVRFAQNVEGILPQMLAELGVYRKAAKREMAKAEAECREEAVALWDAAQKAYKVRGWWV